MKHSISEIIDQWDVLSINLHDGSILVALTGIDFPNSAWGDGTQDRRCLHFSCWRRLVKELSRDDIVILTSERGQ